MEVVWGELFFETQCKNMCGYSCVFLKNRPSLLNRSWRQHFFLIFLLTCLWRHSVSTTPACMPYRLSARDPPSLFLLWIKRKKKLYFFAKIRLNAKFSTVTILYCTMKQGRRSLWDRGTRPPIFGLGGQYYECPPQYFKSNIGYFSSM